MKKFGFVFLPLLFAMAAQAAEPNQAAMTDFVKSLAYLIYPDSATSSPNPKVIPNIWACQVGWEFVDECMDRERLRLAPVAYCPKRVSASFDAKGCDLQAEGEYKLTSKNPLNMSFRVRNSAVIKKVSFQFRFATTIERKPVPENIGSKTMLPYYPGKQAVAIKLMAGKLFGANDEVLANFELDYGLTLRGAPAAYGKSEVQNDGGKVKITFPKKAPLEQSFVFPFAL